jgi:hypothetical protein
MGEKLHFNNLMSKALSAGFERFFDIEYLAPTKGTDIAKHRAVAEKLSRNWVGTVMLSTGTCEHSHIRVTEERADGSIVFHVFLGGCDWKSFEEGRYLLRWYQKTCGAAYERPLEPSRLRGLLYHLVMKLGCPMDVLTGAISPNVIFRRSDFW